MTAELKHFLLIWIVSIIAASTIVGGRIGYTLFRLAPDPPSDPELAVHWQRRRRWLVWSELAALPAFATIAVAAVDYWHLAPIVAVLISMFLGGIGFAMLVDAAQWFFRKRMGMPPAGEDGAGPDV